MPDAERELEHDAEHQVTPLELFFDLVFVFAITQVTSLLADHPTWVGVLRGMLVLATLWWLYFDVAAILARRRLMQASGLEQARLARDAYNYLHLPMVAGIVLFALGLKTTIGHVGEELDTVPALALCGGAGLYCSGTSRSSSGRPAMSSGGGRSGHSYCSLSFQLRSRFRRLRRSPS